MTSSANMGPRWLQTPVGLLPVVPARTSLAEAQRLCASSADPPPGTVEHYKLHEQCLARINTLTDLLEEIAEECDERADADCVGDPPRYVRNIWSDLLMRIRAVVPH